ncbi:hypothetical protein ACEWY4_023709 [Coilia grayii]|uniref:Plectin/eS10 N-terminal domain-containing protein n=1 Tax=Coilia grayii TaxID=363190 RepID=A0ABD1IYA9_9TELE
MVAGMLMSMEDLRSIYEVLFRDGVMVTRKDVRPQCIHPNVQGVSNLKVIRAMGSLKSRGLVRETFAWRHSYWYLTNEGMAHVREFLHLPSEIVPSTLQKFRSTATTLRLTPRQKVHVQKVKGTATFVNKSRTTKEDRQEDLLGRQSYRHKKSLHGDHNDTLPEKTAMGVKGFVSKSSVVSRNVHVETSEAKLESTAVKRKLKGPENSGPIEFEEEKNAVASIYGSLKTYKNNMPTQVVVEEKIEVATQPLITTAEKPISTSCKGTELDMPVSALGLVKEEIFLAKAPEQIHYMPLVEVVEECLGDLSHQGSTDIWDEIDRPKDLFVQVEQVLRPEGLKAEEQAKNEEVILHQGEKQDEPETSADTNARLMISYVLHEQNGCQVDQDALQQELETRQTKNVETLNKQCVTDTLDAPKPFVPDVPDITLPSTHNAPEADGQVKEMDILQEVLIEEHAEELIRQTSHEKASIVVEGTIDAKHASVTETVLQRSVDEPWVVPNISNVVEGGDQVNEFAGLQPGQESISTTSTCSMVPHIQTECLPVVATLNPPVQESAIDMSVITSVAMDAEASLTSVESMEIASECTLPSQSPIITNDCVKLSGLEGQDSILNADLSVSPASENSLCCSIVNIISSTEREEHGAGPPAKEQAGEAGPILGDGMLGEEMRATLTQGLDQEKVAEGPQTEQKVKGQEETNEGPQTEQKVKGQEDTNGIPAATWVSSSTSLESDGAFSIEIHKEVEEVEEEEDEEEEEEEEKKFWSDFQEG